MTRFPPSALAAMLAFGSALVLAPGAPRAEEKLVDGIAAQVGNDIVLYSEVLQLTSGVEAQARTRGAKPGDVARIRAEGLERAIEWRIIEQVVEQTELYATDAEVDAAIQSIAQTNGLSVPELEKSVVSHGMSPELYRRSIKRELERRKVISAMVGTRVRVEEGEVEDLYHERYDNQPDGGTTLHVRQILVPVDPEAGRTLAAACSEVRAAQQRLAEGEDFRQVASEVSVVAPERGGDLGWIHLDKAAPWMQQVVDQLQAGETSDVLELPFGCGLLQLVERREFRPVSYEEVAAQLEAEVFETKMDELYTEWIEGLREETYIERKGYFADAATFARPPDDSDPTATLP